MIGPTEIMVILLVALIVFGPERLSEMAVKLGRWYRTTMQASEELNKHIREMEREATNAMDLPEGSLRNPAAFLGSLTAEPHEATPAGPTIASPPPPVRTLAETVHDSDEVTRDTGEVVHDANEVVETAADSVAPAYEPETLQPLDGASPEDQQPLQDIVTDNEVHVSIPSSPSHPSSQAG